MFSFMPRPFCPPRKESQYPMNSSLGGHQIRFGGSEEKDILDPTGLDPGPSVLKPYGLNSTGSLYLSLHVVEQEVGKASECVCACVRVFLQLCELQVSTVSRCNDVTQGSATSRRHRHRSSAANVRSLSGTKTRISV
jgi:hypothetical protein